jgi:hypothetical protein
MEWERRGSQRYHLELALEFRAYVSRHIVRVGSGWTVNISSGGVLFAAGIPLPLGVNLEMTIRWPVLYEEKLPLQLHLTGRVVRQDSQGTAIQVRHSSLCRVIVSSDLDAKPDEESSSTYQSVLVESTA